MGNERNLDRFANPGKGLASEGLKSLQIETHS